jgi:hypothetical protein
MLAELRGVRGERGMVFKSGAMAVGVLQLGSPQAHSEVPHSLGPSWQAEVNESSAVDDLEVSAK